jgi:phosphohistidine phosphatase SixA
MEIYLMQHGEAYAKDRDPERSLTPNGEDQIHSSGKALRKLGVDVDLIVSSPKKRARQTAEIVASSQAPRSGPDKRLRSWQRSWVIPRRRLKSRRLWSR